MQETTRLKHRLTIGSWITLGEPAVAEIMAKAGFDWLVVDLEHSAIGIAKAAELIRIIDLCGVMPLVRLTSNDGNQIKRVMDAGAHGILVPMVNSVADAKKAVDATRYSPRGNRGVGLGRAQGYGASFSEYLDWQVDGPTVIVQIEHEQAIPELDGILEVPGVSGLIIGPYDLSCSMGIPGRLDDPRVKSALATIRSAGLRHGCITGLHLVEPSLASFEACVREGYNFLAYSVDFRMLHVCATEAVNKARGLLQ